LWTIDKAHKPSDYECFTPSSQSFRFDYYSFSRLKVFENRILRRASGPNRDEITGRCRKLHNRELHKLYSLPNVIRMIKAMRAK
jgi:hypothetical protein